MPLLFCFAYIYYCFVNEPDLINWLNLLHCETTLDLFTTFGFYSSTSIINRFHLSSSLNFHHPVAGDDLSTSTYFDGKWLILWLFHNVIFFGRFFTGSFTECNFDVLFYGAALAQKIEKKNYLGI